MFQKLFKKRKKKSDIMEKSTKSSLLVVGTTLVSTGAMAMFMCESILTCQIPIAMIVIGCGIVYWREDIKKKNGWS